MPKDPALANDRGDLDYVWTLTIRSPEGEPRERIIKPGATTVGRKPDNDIVIADTSASRSHAELQYDKEENILTIRDLGSMNGTYVNRERISQPRRLKPDDQIRIGQHVISVAYQSDGTQVEPFGGRPGTHPITHDLLLESLDKYSILLYTAAARLNTVLDLDNALHEVADLMKRSMGADKCEVILIERINELHEMGFPATIARLAIQQRSAVVIPNAQEDQSLGKSALLLRIRAAMCVPVMSGDDIIALVYIYKTGPVSRPFDQRDLQLAVAISHQAALTIQRAALIKRVQAEQQTRQLLLRFVSPPEAEYLLQGYLQSGHLPGLTEQLLTVLFADIEDSTGLAERLGARRFGEILSYYYQDMTQIVFDHGGLLNKYLGDGLMAVFGAIHDATRSQEEAAVRAALTMLELMKTISQAVGEEINLGVGVNTGPVMAGYLGSQERVEYTVLGDTVNVASGLQLYARPNRIIVGPATYEAVSARFNVTPIGPVEVKKRAQPIAAYEVLPGLRPAGEP